LLHAVHVTPAYPRAPITNAVAMEFLVFTVLVVYFIIVRLSLSVEKPNGVQHLAELTHEFVSDQGEQIIGHGYEKFTGYLAALGLFILLCNLLGLIPGLESPTANVTGVGIADSECDRAAWLCAGNVCVLPLPRAQGEWPGLHQAVPRTGVVAVLAAVSD